jgi:hypothetical protein
MRKMLVAAVAATMFVVVAPAFANPAQEAEEGVSPIPSSLPCHFVLQRTITENGRAVLQRHQVCD